MIDVTWELALLRPILVTRKRQRGRSVHVRRSGPVYLKRGGVSGNFHIWREVFLDGLAFFQSSDAGTHTDAIRMPYAAFAAIAHPLVGDFGVPKIEEPSAPDGRALWT